ncbi:aerolysin-like protein [Saccoglossus kowalevskii]|uniref:Uncharacterized protein LOC102804787 n=1 Tax=Saccoglossus kowalevskii TaxID=10224 RepID=A0ABM0MLV9_SACKO|nr:PREDICTED: uncharacterized protein LOC102804787 [Saccoglossus kowalevskii]
MEFNDNNVKILGSIGGAGGKPFVFYCDGQSLERLDVWADDECIKGIWAALTNHQHRSFGTHHGDYNLEYRTYKFETDERLTNLSIWKNWNGERTGRIEFTTNIGGSFMIGPGGGKKFEFDVQESKAVGLAGRFGADIEQFALMVTKNDVTQSPR